MEIRVFKRLALIVLWMGMTFSLQAQTVVEYIHTDALGTPVAVTNAAGQVIERSEYEPYGQLLNRPLTDGPGFTGHVQDAATGLTYMQQRYYDPGIGRFLSVDPVTPYEKPLTNFNRYVYALNNPYKFTDPDGRVWFLVIPTIIGLMTYADNANAPGPNDTPSSNPAGEQVAAAIPGGGRAIAGFRMAARQGDKLSQRAATREAKRQAGIPTSQQPNSQSNGRAPDGTPVGRQQTHEVPKARGGTETKSVQVSRDTRGDHAGMPQVEAGTVKPGGQVDSAGRPRIQNEDKVRVDFDPKR